MEDLKFRDFIANDGAAEEILRVLVALIETKPADEMAFVLENLGQGTLPPFTSPTAVPSTMTSYEVLQENQALKKKFFAVKAELKQTRDKIKALIPEGTLTVTAIAAHGVPDVDAGNNISDPFVRISLLNVPNLEEEDEETENNKSWADTLKPGKEMDPHEFAAYCDRHRIAAQTSTVMNCTDPSWPEETLEIVMPAGTPRPPKVLVRVWDDDKNADDPIASAEIQLEAGGGKIEGYALKVRPGLGDLPDVMVDFEYAIAENPNKE